MRSTLLAGLVVVTCVAILLADYALAGRRAPYDEKLVKSLQQQLKSDGALAPKLAAEQKRITAARLARKSRDNTVAWLLIAAAAVFLTCAKRLPISHKVPQAVPPAILRRTIPPHLQATAPELDLTFIDNLVAQHGRGKEAAILFLQAIQSHYRYLPDEAVRRLCELTEITPAQVAGTSSFYAQFRTRPMGQPFVRVCHGTACHVSGARQITDELRRYLAIPDGDDTDAARMFTVDEVACVGCCSLAPVLVVNGQTAGRLTPASACAVVAQSAEAKTA
jgi:NADH:ubiquinone oxidoreductase subunit E